MSDEPTPTSAVAAVEAAKAKPPTFWHGLWVFIVANKKPIIAVVLLVLMYFAKKRPELEAERELLDQLWALLVIGAVGLVPGFRMSAHARSAEVPAQPTEEPPS